MGLLVGRCMGAIHLMHRGVVGLCLRLIGILMRQVVRSLRVMGKLLGGSRGVCCRWQGMVMSLRERRVVVGRAVVERIRMENQAQVVNRWVAIPTTRMMRRMGTTRIPKSKWE